MSRRLPTKPPLTQLMGVDLTCVTRAGFRFQIWEIDNDPRFSPVRQVYYRGALGGVVVFDLSSKESFVQAQGLVEELWRGRGRPFPVILLGMSPSHRLVEPAVTLTEIEEFINHQHLKNNLSSILLHYQEANPQVGANVFKVLDLISQYYEATSARTLEIHRENAPPFQPKSQSPPEHSALHKRSQLLPLTLHLKIRCVGDRKTVEAGQASEQGWVQCKTCGNYLCPVCVEFYHGQHFTNCPGSTLETQHPFRP